jgi:hypothetical protein
MVVQEQLPCTELELLVMRIGPPAVPAGSMVPEICIRRFGWVGPKTEQW